MNKSKNITMIVIVGLMLLTHTGGCVVAHGNLIASYLK